MCCSLFSTLNTVSSRLAVATNVVTTTCWKNLVITFSPKRRRFNLKCRLCVLIANNFERSLSILTCRHPSDRPILEITLPSFSLEKTSSTESSPMAWETWVQSQVESYQRLKKWYLMPPCLTLSIIRYGSRVK